MFFEEQNHPCLKITGPDNTMMQIMMFAFDVSAPAAFPAPCLRHFFIHPFKRWLLNDNYVSVPVLEDEDKYWTRGSGAQESQSLQFCRENNVKKNNCKVIGSYKTETLKTCTHYYKQFPKSY